MRIKHYVILHDAIDAALAKIAEDGNPGLVYRDLVGDMTKAAQLVYDSCMQGQEFAKDEERRS
jgi:hypothetical protein